MVRIQNTILDKSDVTYIKDYAKFVLNRFVPKSTQKTALIRIKIARLDDLDDFDYDDDYSSLLLAEVLLLSRIF